MPSKELGMLEPGTRLVDERELWFIPIINPEGTPLLFNIGRWLEWQFDPDEEYEFIEMEYYAPIEQFAWASRHKATRPMQARDLWKAARWEAWEAVEASEAVDLATAQQLPQPDWPA